ncbi:MAG: HD-GYP domain-containing protein [Ruminococcus sp.]|nr:HD-GYP domain-containing protein [Ruminococcus sp.]
MGTTVGWVSWIVNMIIPVLIFMFLNEMIFFSKDEADKDKTDVKSKKLHRKKLLQLIPLSPLGLFVIILASLVVSETLLNAFCVVLGVMDFTSDLAVVPQISQKAVFLYNISGSGFSNEYVLGVLFLGCLIALPILVLMIKRYCKVVSSSINMGLFVYMAVLYMYVTSTIITNPINELSLTASSLISSASFITMLLIFFLPFRDKIELMRQNENTDKLKQINTLPIIIFVLLVILLGLEVMLQKNGYMDLTYYLLILAFALILYSVSQVSYNILFRHIDEQLEIEALTRESKESQEEVILAFAEITEAKSGQTGQHVKRVSEYCRVLAQGMGMSQKEVENIRIASMMHDIGKMLISPEILEKIGSLTEEEFDVMKTHVVIGENLLHNAPGEIMSIARVVAQQHHEWWNGKGYLGMRGEQIALSARITAVADVYDALTSSRSYKKAWSSELARSKILDESGTHFDPKIVEVFDESFEEIVKLQNKYKDHITVTASQEKKEA